MVRWLIVVSSLLCMPAVAGADETRESQQVLVALRIASGDPEGSVEDGTLTIHSVPMLITQAGRRASITVGSMRCDIKPTIAKDGNVRVDLLWQSQDEREQPAASPKRGADGCRVRAACLCRPGEPLQLKGMKLDDQDCWLEVTVETDAERIAARTQPAQETKRR